MLNYVNECLMDTPADKKIDWKKKKKKTFLRLSKYQFLLMKKG